MVGELGAVLAEGAIAHGVLEHFLSPMMHGGAATKASKLIARSALFAFTGYDIVHTLHAANHLKDHDTERDTHKNPHPKVHRNPQSFAQYTRRKNMKDNILLGITAAAMFKYSGSLNSIHKALGFSGIALNILSRNQQSKQLGPIANLASTSAAGAAAAFVSLNPAVQRAIKGTIPNYLKSLSSHLNLNGPAQAATKSLEAAILKNTAGLTFGLALPIGAVLINKLVGVPRSQHNMTPSRYSQPQNIAGHQGDRSSASMDVKYEPPSATVSMNSRLHN